MEKQQCKPAHSLVTWEIKMVCQLTWVNIIGEAAAISCVAGHVPTAPDTATQVVQLRMLPNKQQTNTQQETNRQ